MLSHNEPYPDGQFPLYSGMTSKHIAWVKPVRVTATQIEVEVTDSTWYKIGQKFKFFLENGRKVDFEQPSMRDRIGSVDFDEMVDWFVLSQKPADASKTASADKPEAATYRLGSSGLVFAPGIVRMAVETYPANPKVSVRLLSETWGIPADIAKRVCRKKVPYAIDGETVIINA